MVWLTLSKALLKSTKITTLFSFFLDRFVLDKSNSSANVDDCAPILLEATLADVEIFNLPFVFELLDMLEHCIFQDFNS